MLSSYLTLALRNLLKNRLFSAINIFGLALSMSLGLFILLLIRDAYRYDTFHPDCERVYRINTEAIRKNGGSESYASSPFPVGAALSQGFSQVEESVRLVRHLNGETSGGGKILSVAGMFAEPSFFKIFGFSMLDGNAATALNEPFSIVLTEKSAGKFFPHESAVGKTLEINGYGAFKVTGVMAAFPGKTHLEFEVIASAASIPALEKSEALPKLSEDWNDYYGTYTYIRLRSGGSAQQTEAALAAISKTEYANRTLETRDAGYRFYLQPLDKITPGPMLGNSMGRGLPAMLLWFLSALGAVVMLSACFNYTNLTLARSLVRAREIGVRKVIGASRWQVAGQLLGEGVVTAMLSLGIGWLLMKLVQPAFNSLSFTQFMDVSVKEDGMTILWFVGFALAVGLIAGALPALAMSKISPSSVLRKLEGIRLFKRVGLRKTLLVTQFTVSLVFIIMVTVISKQIGHVMNMDYGFNTAQILNVQLQGQSPDKIIPILSVVPGVERISAASHNMGTYQDWSDDVRVSPEAEPEIVRDYFVDRNFAENMSLTFVAGENFPANAVKGRESFLVVNEKFVERFKLGSPAEAIGKQVLIGDSTRLTLTGVVKDFLFKPASYALEPMMLRNNPAQWHLLNVKIAAGDPTATIVALQRAWSQAVPERPMESEFYDQTIQAGYADMKDILAIIAVFGLLGIVIATLGLLGMATYTVETRAKEVSLRKVMGASVSDLVLLLSRKFLVLLAVAAVIAVPIGWFLGSMFLDQFAYHISLGIGVLLPGILLLFAIGGLTIGSQTMRAALANPIKSLRSE
ncbi:MAG: ABC transporter permease [Phycisphaerae bacterium]|nr:ABC transporter permease [Saprospiraceae bacterium]